jgi:HIV Tat-specific factor 1
LADWDDDDPATLKAPTKWDKIVILKHMFTLKELEEDPAVLLDIKEDVRGECSKFGEVTNVTLFDKEEDGVMSIRFKTPEAATACIVVSRFLISIHLVTL